MVKRVVGAILVLLVIGALAGFWVELHRSYKGYSGKQVLVVEPGMRAPAVAKILQRHGVLVHRLPFLIRYLIGRGRRGTLKAGEYLFDRPLSPEQVYQKLVRGDVYLHSVVIPEGSDKFDIASILHHELGMNPKEFLRATEDTKSIRDLDPKATSLEGYLFPDTYRFPRGVSAETVVATMLARFRQVFRSKLFTEVQQSHRSLHDIITLASLVEKETPEPVERPLIAGVFLKREEKGWPLQSDPTVVYALRLQDGLNERFEGPLTEADLNIDSSYNTYRYTGLPPGPICNPGLASIKAALNPASSQYLYFVSNNEGGHIFARTLAQHNRNVARYRRRREASRHDTVRLKRHRK